jgi:hypothetical protein
VKAKRLTPSSQRAQLLTATPAQEAELQRLSKDGRAHGISDTPGVIEALSANIDFNLRSVFDGNEDVKATVAAPEKAEAWLKAFLGHLPATPPLLVYCEPPPSRSAYRKRRQEAIRAIALGIIDSGWSCVLLESRLTSSASILACWPDRAMLPPVDACLVCHDAIDGLIASIRPGPARSEKAVDDKGRTVLAATIEQMRSRMSAPNSAGAGSLSEPSKENANNARVVSSVFREIANGYSGCEEDGGAINLFFQGIKDPQVQLDRLFAHGRFVLPSGACSLFTGSSSSEDSCRLQMANSSCLLLAQGESTGREAHAIADSLEHLIRRLP